MNSLLFKRQEKITRYPASPIAVNFQSNTWVDLYATGALEYDSELVMVGSTITDGQSSSPLSPIYRVQVIKRGLVDRMNIIEDKVMSVDLEDLLYPTLKLSVGDMLIIQVHCDDDASGNALATLNFIELKEQV